MQRETIVTPENVVFQNSGKSIRNEATGEIPELSKLQFAAVIGISYEVPIGSGAFIEPDIRYALPLTSISGVTWKVNNLQFGASLKFPIFPAPQITILRDTIYKRDTNVVATLGLTKVRITRQKSDIDFKSVREGNVDHQTTTITENFLKEIPLNSKFEMSVSVVGIEKNGTRQSQPTIRIEEIETEEGFPLLPHVFFIEGSTMLSQTDVHQLTPEKASKFSEEQLPRNTLEIYKDMLNIIGSRMQLYPTASITITGTNNTINTDKTTPNLSLDRAETVRKYLQSAWSIAPERINTAAQNLPSNAANNTADDGQAENRRAEITSTETEILKPVILREIVRTLHLRILILCQILYPIPE
ncbi:MAG: OmpA family protein [Ignavibacteria bacterium]|nr:OmpA family protein [Ignavibacteria bacterium]